MKTEMASTSFIVMISLMTFTVQTVGKEFIRLCYFPSWANTRTSEKTRFDIQHIDPALCTHLVYAFSSIDTETHKLVPGHGDDNLPGQPGRYRIFNNLKNQNPHLKTLLSVGGENAHSDSFMSVANSGDSASSFATDAVKFLRNYGFDGLDVDWEFPIATTKTSYIRLLKALRTAFDADPSGREHLLLTVALPAGKQFIDNGFDVPAINRYVDLANLMTYDYHGGWSSVTGFDSPLYSRLSDPNFDPTLSTDWTVNYYTSKGLKADKILVGVTGAGAWFKLQNTSIADVGAPVDNGTKPVSDIWGLTSRLAYPEICWKLQSATAKSVLDEEQGVPYAVFDDEWVGYEDPKSLKVKVDYMNKAGVAGVMFWALDLDDFNGKFCDNGKYPLLRALSSRLGPSQSDLTKNVNQYIRYLTKYRGGAAGSLLSGGFLCFPALRVFCGALGAIIVAGFARQ